MVNIDYLRAPLEDRDAIDSAALAGLELAFEVNRELKEHGATQRHDILLNTARLAIGHGGLGEKSPYIGQPDLAYTTRNLHG